MSLKLRRNITIGFFVFCFVIITLVCGLSYKSSMDAQNLLKESTRSQLTSIALSARRLVDHYAFSNYNSLEDMEGSESYKSKLADLRKLAEDTGAKYIYALKEFNGEYRFVFDTDTEDNALFEVYELSEVHRQAFKGNMSFQFGMVDDYGSFNSASAPIFYNGDVAGIICVDFDDALLVESEREVFFNLVLLVCAMVVTFAIMGVILFFMYKKIHEMQTKLERMAHYDKLTNLPNRQYLLEYLGDLTAKRHKTPFALYFIDLDNFKKVNDNAGHDAGDELLQNIGNYLASAQKSSTVFRPGSGNINVAARIGGDEFVIVAPQIDTPEDAAKFAEELLDGFRSDAIDKYIDKYNVGLSIGVALFPLHSENFHVLIKYADIAMYHTKHAGKNCYRIYTDEMKQKDEK